MNLNQNLNFEMASNNELTHKGRIRGLKMRDNQIIKVGVSQFDVTIGDLESNFIIACDNIHTLGDQGAEVVVLPEMWSCGFDNESLSTHAEKTPFILENLSQISNKYNMVIIGSLPECFKGNIYNTIYVVDRTGDISGSYRKIHLFSLTQEDRYFSAGNRAVVCNTGVGPIGLMICYDLRFPELCRALTLNSAQIIAVSAQWPLSRIDHWDVLIKARAIENQVFIIASNRCGKDPDIEYGGHSQVVSPNGTLLTNAKNENCSLITELNFKDLTDFRQTIPCLEDRSIEAYKI